MPVTRIESSIPYDSNIFLLKGDRNVLIDTGTGLDSDNTVSRIRDSVSGLSLDMVILTHCHVDHIGGLGKIIEEFSCDAYAFPPDSDFIRSADSMYTLDHHFGIDLDPQPIKDLSNGQVIDHGEYRLRVIHTPGHTPGGICLFDEISNDLFSGDTLFAGGVGRTDFPGGSTQQLIESLRLISNIDIRGLYPGHGDCSTQHGPDYVKRGLRVVGELI